MIHNIYHQYIFTRLFPRSQNFSTSKDFFFIKEVLHEQRFFLHQGSFPQADIFPSSRKFSTGKDYSFIKEVFHKQRFFHKPRLFLDQGRFPKTKYFFTSKEFFMIIKLFSKQILFPKAEILYIHTILKILCKNILTYKGKKKLCVLNTNNF